MKGIKISHHQNLELIDIEDAKTPQAGEVLLKLCYVGFAVLISVLSGPQYNGS